MKSLFVTIAALAIFNLSTARADDEVSQPPTEQDRPATAGKPEDAGKGKEDAFGQKVKAEVIKLKEEGKNRKGGVGKWVSGQRRQDADHRQDGSHRGSPNEGGTDGASHGGRPATAGPGANSGHGPH